MAWIRGDDHGYEVTGTDVPAPCSIAPAATARAAAVREQAQRLVSAEMSGGFVTTVPGRELGL